MTRLQHLSPRRSRYGKNNVILSDVTKPSDAILAEGEEKPRNNAQARTKRQSAIHTSEQRHIVFHLLCLCVA